jgi:hypothetical protein
MSLSRARSDYYRSDILAVPTMFSELVYVSILSGLNFPSAGLSANSFASQRPISHFSATCGQRILTTVR